MIGTKKIINLLNSDPVAQELLQSSIPARLAYIGIDESPRVVPVGFYWNGAEVVICTATNAPKVRALKVNPKVAMTIDTVTQPPHVLLVRGTAHLELVEGVPPEYLKASQKALDPRQWTAFEAQVRALYKEMVRITIVPEWAQVFDFETRLPGFLVELAAGQNGK